MRPIAFLSFLSSIALAGAADAGEMLDLAAIAKKPLLPKGQAMREVQEFLEKRIPKLPAFRDKASWEAYTTKLRADIFDNVVYRGEAAAWRNAKTKAEWLETLPGGPGYRLKQVRFEAIPGLWIPALLYEPEELKGKVPATLNVMGHEGGGKDVAYQQIRCINLAKRGMIALNVEWYNFGQLRNPTGGYHHGRMNQLDLCGTSGLAPFYLSLKRSLDVLLSHPNADPARVAVSGLSGGGWQTIWISAMDTRVTLTDPVAGYSSFFTRVRHHEDLGDSEQTPCDMAKYADYAHLTAMMAPRPTLLTYNAKDQCCFASGHALQPLMEAAGPFFRLYGNEKGLRAHVNHVPGTHNFERDNREAFYRMLGDFFYPGDAKFSAEEIPADKEVRKAEELRVPMPEKNADFQSLAFQAAKDLPNLAALPKESAGQREKLNKIVAYHAYSVEAESLGQIEKAGVKITFWRLFLGRDWSVPVVELTRGNAKKTTLILSDMGRRGAVAEAEKLLVDGSRILVMDPFYLGEQELGGRAYLFGLLAAAVGERPLGIQASQIAAAARWSKQVHGMPCEILSLDELSSLQALVAASLEVKAIGNVETRKCLTSLKQVIERNLYYQQRPEFFCFGLLEYFDIPQLVALSKR